MRTALRKVMLPRTEPAVVTAAERAIELSPGDAVLFLRQDKIGDLLVSVPVIREFARRHPGVHIDVVLGRANHSVAYALGQYVRTAYRYDKSARAILSLRAALRRNRYKAVIDLMDNPSTTSTLLVGMSGARAAVGIDKDNRNAYTHVVPLLSRATVHIVERICMLLLPFGISPEGIDTSLEYSISEADRSAAADRLSTHTRGRRFIAVNISGSSENKYWGRDNFTALCSALKERYPQCETVLFGAAGYEAELDAIASATGCAAVSGLPSFHHFAACLHQASAIVTPDTSAVHLAAAWRTPAVILFIADNPDLMPWYPWRSPHRSLLAKQHVAELSVKQVLSACTDMFDIIEDPGR